MKLKLMQKLTMAAIAQQRDPNRSLRQAQGKSNNGATFQRLRRGAGLRCNKIKPLTTARIFALSRVRCIALGVVVGLTGLSGTSNAQLTPEWISRVPVGTSLSAGTAGI